MLEVYLVLGILGLLYAKSNNKKAKEPYIDYVKDQKVKVKEASKLLKNKNVFPVQPRTKDDTKIIGLTGKSILKESFLTRDDHQSFVGICLFEAGPVVCG